MPHPNSVRAAGRAAGRPPGGTTPAVADALAAERQVLLRYAHRMVGGDPDAADLAERAVGHAAARADRLPEGADAHAWVFQIAYHLALESGRHHDAEVSLGSTERLWRDGTYRVDDDLVVERAGRRAVLQDAVLRLPVHYRNVVVLHDALGWAVEDIAAMLGVAPVVARDRLRRARMMLVSALDGRPDDPDPPAPPLSCAEARAWVSRLVDDELGPEERDELSAHLASCPTCPSLHRALAAVSAALRCDGREVAQDGPLGHEGSGGPSGDGGSVAGSGRADGLGGAGAAGGGAAAGDGPGSAGPVA